MAVKIDPEIMITAIALSYKPKIEAITKEIEDSRDLLFVADKYEELAGLVREMDADIKEVSDDS